jgi:raffinose/stachyose/melibiose transport system permease protein
MFGRPTAARRVVHQLLATLIVLPFLLPMYAIVATSFSGQGAVANYTAVITQTPFLRFLLNTAVISVGTIAVVFVCTMLAAYAFSKMRFTGRVLLFNSILVGLALPGVALLVPMFIFVRTFHLFNNYLAVILPLSAVIIPLTLLLTHNFLSGVPDELIEAAKLDGATNFRTLVVVVMPLSRPIIAVVIVWTFLNSWNEFFLPLIFLQDTSMQAVTQVPIYFSSAYGTDQSKIFAAIVLISLPVVVAYVALQRYFERGLTAGAIK